MKLIKHYILKLKRICIKTIVELLSYFILNQHIIKKYLLLLIFGMK